MLRWRLRRVKLASKSTAAVDFDGTITGLICSCDE